MTDDADRAPSDPAHTADVDTLPDDVDTLPEDVETAALDTAALDTADLDTADLETAALDTADLDTSRDGAVAAPTGRRRLDKGLLAACFVIAAGITLIAWGLTTAQTGQDGIDRPEVIENLSPVENALQVLQQETIVVDFEFGYEAELEIDGILLETTRIGELDLADLEPGEQIATPPTAVFDPGNSRIEFRPTEGAQIEELTEGRHTARVVYWPVDEGRGSARSYTWSFEVL